MRILDLNPLDLGEVDGRHAPGLSAFVAGKWVHGQEAFGMCRRDPQSVRFQVWENLSLNPIRLPGGMRHSADLAAAQLKALCPDAQKGTWMVLTPAHWQKEHLQVFLGVAASCQMDVRVLMPRVLAVNQALGDRVDQAVGWEWHWHRLSKVNLERSEGGWRLGAVTEVAEAGVMDFYRRESREIARMALESHRLDPLHTGETEQDLFESWWQWHQGKGDFSFSAGGVTMDFSSEADQLRSLHAMMPATAMGKGPEMLVHGLGWPTDFVEVFSAQGLEGRLGDLSEPGARWKECLPVGKGFAETTLPVTHVVVDGIAEPVGERAGLVLGQRVQLADGRDALAIHVPEA
ncbi:hypothetical protein P3T73_09430 [Kiritimatiellota bacterium B12222]|nr:hypothetical protein P3T73_09430 [Kiritimatiellota bacterium B12222]